MLLVAVTNRSGKHAQKLGHDKPLADALIFEAGVLVMKTMIQVGTQTWDIYLCRGVHVMMERPCS